MKTKNFRIFFGVCLSLFAGTAINSNAQKTELVVQTGHSEAVRSVAFSSDGKTLASGSGDTTIKLWDVESGKELRTLKGHSDTVFSVSFSSNGKTLASGSGDDTIKLWAVESGKELRTLKGHSDTVFSVAFSSDGKTLASGGSDNTIKLWAIESGKELRALTGHSHSVRSVAFSSDGKTLASGSGDNTIKLWAVESGNELRTLKGHSSSIFSVSFSSDGKTLASGDSDKTIKLWDVESGKELRTLTGHSSYVNSVSFSSDGRTLASGSEDKTIKLWDVESGKELGTLNGHSSSVESLSFSSDGKTLASGNSDTTIKLWDVESGKELGTLTGHSSYFYSVSFSSDGRTLASGSWDNTIKLWDVETGRELRTLTGHSDSVTSVAFSSDGKTFASGSLNKTVKLWDVETGKELRTLTGHSDQVTSVAFSSDGKTLASGSWDNTIKLWDVESGKELRTLTGPFYSAYSVSFSSDGNTLASGNSDNTIKLWDVESGKELRTLSGHADSVRSVTFRSDGNTLASGSDDKTIKLWDVESGKELRTLTGHADSVWSVSYSSDGITLASGSWDKTIKLWDAETGKELRTFEEHSDWVLSVSFRSDGRTLASASAGRTKLWDVATGKEICSLMALDENDWVVTTPDGRFDTNKIEDSQGIHWVVSDDPLKPFPLEIFMRDYFEPKLLPRLIKCNKEKNCDRQFKLLPNIAELNRVQPPVKITNVSLPDANRRVRVTVEVARGAVPEKECRTKRCETGAYDLRLFRDGQMVGTYPRDGQAALIKQSESLKTSIADKDLWRKVSVIEPDKTAGCKTASPECTALTFEVELPKGKNAADIEFTAYAFNEDRIKSQTAHWQWPEDVKAKLPKAQTVKPRAYIIAVGVNAYENPDWNLKYAANDARQIQRTLSEKLSQGGEYQELVPISLISDYQTKDGQSVVSEKLATKANIRAVLNLLAGKQVDPEVLKGIPNADKLRKATPDDLIIISFSSHGYADNQGNFYFIPYDVGPGSKREITSDLLRHCISSEELSLWLRDVDAGEMVMVVDACHSAASVQGEGFKPGPMGSRGLGQLSYDKGIRILTSTQSDDVALETDFTQQGLLSYALTHDGIEAGEADFKPRDKVIMLTEWLEYAADRVPKLYGEIEKKYQTLALNELKSIGVGQGGRTKLLIFSRDGSNSSLKKGSNQQPSLFDFTRKKREVVLATMK